MQFFAKSDHSFRDASRREDAELLRRAFPGQTQSEMARNARRKIGISERQFVYWLHCESDMPSWAVKAAQRYLDRLEAIARRIEGE